MNEHEMSNEMRKLRGQVWRLRDGLEDTLRALSKGQQIVATQAAEGALRWVKAQEPSSVPDHPKAALETPPTRYVQVLEPEAGQLLKEARKAAGLTQAQVAERVGLGVSCLSDHERGTRPLSFQRYHMLKEALK